MANIYKCYLRFKGIVFVYSKHFKLIEVQPKYLCQTATSIIKIRQVHGEYIY